VEEGRLKGDAHRLHNRCVTVCVTRLRNLCLCKRESDIGYVTGIECVCVFFLTFFV